MTFDSVKNQKFSIDKSSQLANELYHLLAKEFCKAKPSINRNDLTTSLAKQEISLIRGLWETFTTERGDIPRYLMDPNRQTAAYILGFHLPNMMRNLNVWKRLGERKALEAHRQEPVHLIDVGCGSGALTHASILALKNLGFQESNLSMEGYDKSGRFLDAYRFGNQHLAPNSATRSVKLDINKFDPRKVSLEGPGVKILLLGYVWNEIGDNPRLRRKIEQLCVQTLSEKKGLVMILEPANQQPARALMEFRNQLIQMGDVAYPCNHSNPCPMLNRSRDWCYSEFRWTPPKAIQYIDRVIGIDRKRLNTGALVIGSKGFLKPNTQKNQPVVVGRPVAKSEAKNRTPHSKFHHLLCSEDGLTKTPDNQKNAVLRGCFFDRDRG